MIRAGRRPYVQTITDLAAARGVSLQTLRNAKMHLQDGHPAPVSSPQARTLLWDREQTDAYAAGKPVPMLSEPESGDDLLDRHEAAAELGVAVASWAKYKRDPALSTQMVLIAGVEHWPRRTVRAFEASRREKPRAAAGRPTGHGDIVPREQLLDRIAQLLNDDPARTAGAIAGELGVALPTAQRGVAAIRGRRIADLLERRPELSPAQAALELGYPTVTHRRALQVADLEARARQVRPYLQQVADTLAAAGQAEQQSVQPQRPADGDLVAVIPLADTAAAPALVWHERHGWRTATSRRHPVDRKAGDAPVGEGIRYLTGGLRPEPADVLAALDEPGAWGARRASSGVRDGRAAG